MTRTEEIYARIESYASERGMTNTLLALPLIQEKLSHIMRRTFRSDNKGTTSFQHCLESAAFLLDLEIGLDQEEEDILLASMLCHDILENVSFPEGGQELVTDYHLDPRVLAVVKMIARPQFMTDAKKEAYYESVKKDKFALIVTIADRSNLVEQLTGVTISEANSYVVDMRKYVLPICIYGKEYYRDSQMAINIMMEKIRCLIDVSDIISGRYEKRELAYANERMQLLEENARLRGMIRQLENGEIQ